ncbi:acyl-CoA/acyl-ACP dehydrogenase [Nonomuraea glycinis]|uniref:Acyl-CoA dehydrogenase n=1 Tax=Nonomuraea glycinis TaxID=2047744 RepID=A0A918ADU5_9ACTN|nr:acyl-CoA dehydrogenase family protein [Nonomuraea glycinis]MCA2181869.1 acyl-CoA/acyl-ACP dehydrogenase [Nonomuraea glycinis]GGP15753.1 acyl-CoA dehydrogenase [Nonomuraea glycinis]
MITTDEQEELRSTVRTLLARTPPSRPAPDAEAGYDETIWRLLADQVGAFGLAVPEEHGGAGCTLAETQVVCEELGRAVATLPYLGSAVLATQALLACGATSTQPSPADSVSGATGALPGLADGSRVGALAWAEGGTWDPAAIRAQVAGGRLTGVKEHVLDGARADLFIVPARTPDGGLGLYRVDPAAPGVRVESLVTLDRTRPQARVRFDAAPARLLAADGRRVLERLLAVAATALSAEQLGGSDRCLEMTLAYVKVREQFGRPIGSFQAVKHRLADLYVLVESARSVSRDAARALADDAPDLGVRAATAQAYCAEAYAAVAAETIQLHGGIGFTWEHEAHLHFKRAHAAAALFGSPAWHRARLAAHVLDE